MMKPAESIGSRDSLQGLPNGLLQYLVRSGTDAASTQAFITASDLTLCGIVIQYVTRALRQVFRRLARSQEGRVALHGQRSLFVRNQEELTPEEEQTLPSPGLTFGQA